MTDQTPTPAPAPEPATSATVYRYAIKYFIVDEFGTLLFTGTTTMSQRAPRPTKAEDIAAYDARTTVKSLRRSCDEHGFPAGRILIAAVFPVV